MKENLNFFISLPLLSEESPFTILFDSGYNKSYIENEIIKLYPDILSKVVIEIAVKMSPEIKKEKGLTGFVVVHKRWIVERSNSWMEKCRILWKNCEGKLITSVGEIKLCFIRLILRRLYGIEKT